MRMCMCWADYSAVPWPVYVSYVILYYDGHRLCRTLAVRTGLTELCFRENKVHRTEGKSNDLVSTEGKSGEHKSPT